MTEARDVMDAVTAAVMAGDTDRLRGLYAPDAVATTPEGELHGREEIASWMAVFSTAFPDTRFEIIAERDVGDTAMDEAYLIGTHTGPLPGPGGEVPPTGRAVRLRECDVATVRDGLIREHHFYYDRAQLMEQLGLVPA